MLKTKNDFTYYAYMILFGTSLAVAFYLGFEILYHIALAFCGYSY